MSLDREVAENIAHQKVLAEGAQQHRVYVSGGGGGGGVKSIAAVQEDYAYRQAFDVFRNAWAYRKNTEFMVGFRKWLVEQRKDLDAMLKDM